MPRRNSIKRAPGDRVIVCLDGVEHTLTEPAFIALMRDGLRILQTIEKTADYIPPDKDEAL